MMGIMWVDPWIKNEILHYIFCEHFLNIQLAVCFQLRSQPNYKKCNMFHCSFSVVYRQQTEWNKIFTMWDSMCCNLNWGLFLSAALVITLKRDGNPSCFMLNAVNGAVTEKIGTIVLTKCWIERHTILSLNSILRHRRSGVTWHLGQIKCLQNMTHIPPVNYYDNLSHNSSNTKIQQSQSHLIDCNISE